MRLLPAIAAVIVSIVALTSLLRGDWGVLVISGALGVIAISQLLALREEPPPPQLHDDP